jgi:uncharacterized protein YndB with AHSA1/START domain
VIVVSHSLTIRRSPADVFAFVTDPSQPPRWQAAEEVEQLTPGPVGRGTRFREVQVSLRRRREQITEVAAFDPGRRFEIRVVEGPPVDGRWDFEETDGGTRLTFTPLIRLPGILRPLRPVVALGTLVVSTFFHRRLKRILEGPSPHGDS